MSDDIGNIKLKITRSPSEASKRVYEPSEPSEVCFVSLSYYSKVMNNYSFDNLRTRMYFYQIIEV